MNRYVKASLLVTVGVIAYLAVAALYVQSVVPEVHQRYDSDERVRAFYDAYGPGGAVAVTTTGSLWSVDSVSYSVTKGTKFAALVIHVDEHDRMELNCYDDVFDQRHVKSHRVDSPSIDDIASSVSACGFSDTGRPIPP